MALYWQAALTNENSVFQNDKSDDKKFFAAAKVRGTLDTHATTSVPTSVLVASFPLNAESVEFKSIAFNRQINMSPNIALNSAIHNIDKIGLPIPLINFQVAVGLGDQQNNANIANLTEFNKQSLLFVPLFLDALPEKMEIPTIKEKFKLTSNLTFLNIFFFMSVVTTGDITAFQTDFNAFYTTMGGAANAMGDFLFDMNVVIAGKSTLPRCR